MIPGSVRILILIHIGISLGGVLVHMNLHPVGKSLYYLWAAPLSAFSLAVIPFLYYRPSTVRWGFMLNAGTVLIGTIGMMYYAVLTVHRPLTLHILLFESTLPAILVLWIKVPVSWLILKNMKPLKVSAGIRGCAEVTERA